MVYLYKIDDKDVNQYRDKLQSWLDHDEIVSWFRSVLKNLPKQINCNDAIREAIRAGNRDVVRLLIRKCITTESTKRIDEQDCMKNWRNFTPRVIAEVLKMEFIFEPNTDEIFMTCDLIVQDINLHITKVDRLREDSQAHRVLSELSELELTCQKELDTMKEEIPGTKVSLFHVLTTRDPKYTLNKTLLRALESINLEKFPLYGSMIEDKIVEDKEEAHLLEKCTRYLGDLLKNNEGVMLPSELLERILSNLEHYDLYLMECWAEGVEAKYTRPLISLI